MFFLLSSSLLNTRIYDFLQIIGNLRLLTVIRIMEVIVRVGELYKISFHLIRVVSVSPGLLRIASLASYEDYDDS